MADESISKDKWFYFVGGKAAKDIEELVSRLKEITSEEFVFHVNGAKNDFANWIEGVFGHKELADDVRNVMEKKDTIHVLKRHLHQKKSLLPGFSKEELVEHVPQEMLSYRPADSAIQQDFSQVAQGSADSNSNESFDDYDKAAQSMAKQLEFGASPAFSDFARSSEEETYTVSNEHEITPTQLRDIAEDAANELKIDGRKAEVLHSVAAHHDTEAHNKFIVKEFIYGFILGLIFGLIMLGTLYNIGG